MPHEIDSARRCADLLAALARTANVRLALKETGISACWAYRRKRADADFAARWKTAVRAGRRALAKAAAACARDPRAPRPGAGERQMLVGSTGKGTLRLECQKPCSFTDTKRAVFLSMLRATCNVRAAARAAGISAHGAYSRYHADAALRAEWNAALVEGRVHLEMALLGAARAVLEGPGATGAGTEATGDPDSDGDAPTAAAITPAITGVDAHLAMRLVQQHGTGDARGRARRQSVEPADAEATRRQILAKVAAVKAAREVGRFGGTTIGEPGAPSDPLREPTSGKQRPALFRSCRGHDRPGAPRQAGED